jgi:hypothetical protein
MKKYCFFIFCSASFSCFAQKEKWSVSISTGMAMWGPSASIRHQMNLQRFNDVSTSSLLGYSSNTHYPRKILQPSLMLRFSKKINKVRSAYVIIGQSDKGTVAGFKNRGYNDLWIAGSSFGPQPKIKYAIYQLAAGFMYNTGSRAKLIMAPSLFFVPYSSNNGEKHSSFVPGASFMARMPLGKERHQLGIDLLFDANLAPPIKMSVDEKAAEGFYMKTANMMHLSVGLACTFRKNK